MNLYIRNMVCDRCKMVVRTQLEQLGLNPIAVDLGKVVLAEKKLSDNHLEQVNMVLINFGFGLLTNKKQQTVEKIKTAIIQLIHHKDEPLKINLSSYLAQQIDLSYSSIGAIFKEVEGKTIEKYLIDQKIEKVKELITYNEISLSEIAYRLNYSSVAHLSAQFKKVTGLTPSAFKIGNGLERKTIDRASLIS